jgi:serine-type D-Ala-D-Ala carboxypeptidase/endopeptidase (penicillin-binding protein 4)
MKIFCVIFLQISTYSSQLNSIISQFLGHPSTENVNVSMSIRNAKTGTLAFAYQSKMALPPASTLKLLTTATAFEILGADYKFKTHLKTNGNVINNSLNGDLIICSDGDFSFGSKRFNLSPINDIIEILKKKGIKTITGSIRIEENRQYQIPKEWLVGDLGNYYGAFPGQFSFNENYYSVFFKGGDKIGDSASISKIIPYSSDWKVTNKVKSADKGTGDQVNILNFAPSNEIVLEGTVPIKSSNFEVKGSIPDIKRVFVGLLRAEMLQNGIVCLEEQSVFSANCDTLGSLYSPNLSAIAEMCNFRSVNFFADGLANYILYKMADSTTRFDGFLKDYWQTKGLKLSNFTFIDGSGLSPMNTFSADAMTAFLSSMTSSKYFDAFLNSIPRVGQSGTVASLDLGGITKARIYAKSGSISGTRNYSGYFLGNNNELFAFCIYVNGFNDTAQLFSRQLLQNLMFKMIDLNQE